MPTIVAAASLALALTAATGGEKIKSGLQVGDQPSPFNVRDCTGPAAGKTLCYYCRYGFRPVVSIFATEITDETVALIRKVDESVGKYRDHRLAAFVVFLADNPFEAEKQLKALAEKHRILRTPLTVFRDTKHVLRQNYKVSADAGVTVMMWVRGDVKVNHAFGPGKLRKTEINTIIADTSKILKLPVE
jgi:hypothetical protein